MSESMGTMALTGAPLYGKMLRRLLDSPEPLLFHCSAGKDRTGLSAALLMRILGVNEEAIVADYLLVNQLMPPEKFAAACAERFSAMTGQEMSPDPSWALGRSSSARPGRPLMASTNPSATSGGRRPASQIVAGISSGARYLSNIQQD